LEKVVAFCFFEMTWMGMSTSEIRQKRKEIMEKNLTSKLYKTRW
jgi:hypothetical protein